MRDAKQHISLTTFCSNDDVDDDCRDDQRLLNTDDTNNDVIDYDNKDVTLTRRDCDVDDDNNDVNSSLTETSASRDQGQALIMSSMKNRRL